MLSTQHQTPKQDSLAPAPALTVPDNTEDNTWIVPLNKRAKHLPKKHAASWSKCCQCPTSPFDSKDSLGKDLGSRIPPPSVYGQWFFNWLLYLSETLWKGYSFLASQAVLMIFHQNDNQTVWWLRNEYLYFWILAAKLSSMGNIHFYSDIRRFIQMFRIIQMHLTPVRRTFVSCRTWLTAPVLFVSTCACFLLTCYSLVLPMSKIIMFLYLPY